MAQSRSNLTVENFLNETHAELVSPNGRFVLRLEPSGNLRYLEILQSDKLLPTHLFEKSLFSTSTGDAWPGKHIVTLQSNGILQVRVKTTFLSDWKTTWTSSLLPQCKKLSTTHGFPVLSVADSGLLAIYFQHD
ncbi:unnamed protein product, partial [Adineta ricciae]